MSLQFIHFLFSFFLITPFSISYCVFVFVFAFALSQPLPSSIQGEWRLLHASIGISAMHIQLLRNNKVVMFDRTDFGPSNLSLPFGRCRYDPYDTVLRVDCTAHSLLYDIGTDSFRPLMVETDTWCSSGAVLPSGTLVQTGGYNDGDHVVRTLTPCHDDQCDWVELSGYLLERRWYASNQILPDGRIIIVGGRRQFNYEFYPKNYDGSSSLYPFDFLIETSDESENNLYPFLHLLPDGNLFIFANIRSILFDYKNNRIVKEFPPITGDDPRNYPSSGSSVMLPLDENKSPIEVEIMICGGAPQEAFPNTKVNNFTRAISTCGRIKTSDENPSWTMETMPMPRVMGDMILLPNGDVLIINGAGSGTAGWENARNPVTRPLIYHLGERNSFSVMKESSTPRLYHSTAILIPDGRILVGGSNPHIYYNFTNVDFPTELSLEAFSPPYLSRENDPLRPRITYCDEIIRYRRHIGIRFELAKFLTMADDLTVRIVAPSFTTHSFGMNQRMVVLKMVQIKSVELFKSYRVTVVGPSTVEIAPSGYYILFIVHAGIPSSGTWVKVQ